MKREGEGEKLSRNSSADFADRSAIDRVTEVIVQDLFDCYKVNGKDRR